MLEKFLPFITTASGVIIGFLLGLLKEWIQRKNDFKERLINDAYQRRLAVYEEALNFLSRMTKREITLNAPPVPAAEIFEDIHTLENLLDRLAIFGNYAFRKPLALLHGKFVFAYKRAQSGIADCSASDLVPFAVRALNEFTGLVRKEAGADFLDMRTEKFHKGVKGVGCNKRRKHNAKRNADHGQ